MQFELRSFVMYCPKCAAQNEPDAKFCRACGQDLTLVSQAMNRSRPMVLVSQVGEELNLYKELRRKPSITRGAYFTAIGLILLVVNFLPILVYGGAHFGLASGMNVLLAFFFFGMGIRELVKYNQSIAREAQDNRERPSSNSQALSPAQASLPSSITESTTQRLDSKHEETKDIR